MNIGDIVISTAKRSNNFYIERVPGEFFIIHDKERSRDDRDLFCLKRFYSYDNDYFLGGCYTDANDFRKATEQEILTFKERMDSIKKEITEKIDGEVYMNDFISVLYEGNSLAGIRLKKYFCHDEIACDGVGLLSKILFSMIEEGIFDKEFFNKTAKLRLR